jgi:ABC-type multidrug transport system fused ATPase/permease subunit
VGQQFHASTDGMAAAERIFAVIDEPSTLAPPSTLTPPSALAPPSAQAQPSAQARSAPDPAHEPLRFEGVSLSYPARDTLALHDLELTLEPGRITALVGRSGAGKSSVAALAMRLVDPSGGRVSCGGVDLREIEADAWRRAVAWVPQRTRLFAGTIAENIALADPSAPRERVLAAATDAGLEELLATLSDGLDTPVGDGGRGLSAGQAQRVALARAFLREASLVILDEPTAHLDSDTAAAVGAAIERLAVGRTTLLIAHDTRLAARADHVVVLEDGRTRKPEAIAAVA